MKSPFPGMDPYLEAHWGDVHTSLITYARDLLRPQLPGDLKVRVEESISVQDPEAERSDVCFPDVRIVEKPWSSSPGPAESSSLAVAEPVLVPRQAEAPTDRSLQIIDTRSGNRIVTTIEILSLANKCDTAGRSADRKKKKQRKLAQSNVNLVEIDLLREGSYVLNAPCSPLRVQHRAKLRNAFGVLVTARIWIS